MTTAAPRSTGILIVAIALLVVAAAALTTTLLVHVPGPGDAQWYVGSSDGDGTRLVDPYDPSVATTLLIAQLATAAVTALALLNLIFVIVHRRRLPCAA